MKKFIYNGGGFIGVGEPAAHQYEGHFFQLATVMGVEEENGFNLDDVLNPKGELDLAKLCRGLGLMDDPEADK